MAENLIYGKSVFDFGAKGDGKSDDTEAFVKAAQSGESLICIPFGSYTVNKEIIVKYTKNAEETSAQTEAETTAPAETEAPADKEEGVTASTVIAIVIMGVVILAIIIGAVLLMRSDKKDKSKGKNNSAKGKK